MEDVLVVGGGPAGLATALYAGRRGCSIRVFEKETLGGELVNRREIENFPSVPDVSGTTLRSNLVEQLTQYEVTSTKTPVEEIRPGDPHRVITGDGEFCGRTVVVATGGHPRGLDVHGADDFIDRGIFSCATCDAPLYADETVAVVGSNDWALSDACYLTEYASRVIVIEEGASLEAGESVRERVNEASTIEIRCHTTVEAVDGDAVIERIKLHDSSEDIEYWEAVGGLYVQRGTIPATDFFECSIRTTDTGAIAVDHSLETTVPGIFAAGDVRQGSSNTVAGAIGDGATAFRSVMRHLEREG